MPVAVPTASQTKSKTKAKARYLKRKKERRKHRKAESRQTQPNPIPKHDESSSVSETEAEDISVVTEPVTKTEGPPPKRRKIDPDPKEDSDEHDQTTANSSSKSESNNEDNIEKPAEVLAQSPSPPAGLPSFPLPVAPDAPSKAALALQGLDKALLSAEIVNPSQTLSIDALNATRNSVAGDLPVISEKMSKRLLDLGITEFFAVQTVLLPFLLSPQRRSRALYCPYDPPRDVCASAPTGSGKTLAYVIPIVEILSTRIATRLRALIVLPTRDLALQVQETFEAVSKGRGLKIALVTGQHSFAHEQNQLVPDQGKDLKGGASKVDILICTPGRLIDHLNGTPGFTLQHLRFLVIDEADRLLAQSFQDWLAQVLNVLRPPPMLTRSPDPNDCVSPLALSSAGSSELSWKNLRHDGIAPNFLPHIRTAFDDPKHSSCQKLLFSATLTRDPARIAALGLHDPKYFVVQGQGLTEAAAEDDKTSATAAAALGMEDFAMPPGLKEHYVTTSTSRKPLILFYLIHKRGVSNALVFTKSAESTARLVKLLEHFEDAYTSRMEQMESGPEPRKRVIAMAYSSDLPAGERKSILDKFKKQEIDILICSDLVARGLDIPHVAHVVSYDAPIDLRKYVHRAGRTARAGRSGDAWTLVEEQEAKFFKDMLRGAGEGRLERVSRVRVRDAELKHLEEYYDVALQKLKEAYSRHVAS